MAKQIYKTMRGRQIDMGALATANAEQLAVGNAKMNARGDMLGPQGVVLRTQEQVEAEWIRNQQRQDEIVGISKNIKASLPPDATVARTSMPDQHFDPSSAAAPEELSSTPSVDNGEQVKKIVQQRRKIVEAD